MEILHRTVRNSLLEQALYRWIMVVLDSPLARPPKIIKMDLVTISIVMSQLMDMEIIHMEEVVMEITTLGKAVMGATQRREIVNRREADLWEVAVHRKELELQSHQEAVSLTTVKASIRENIYDIRKKGLGT